MGRVFITTGMARTCLAAVRSLGKQGLEVTVGEEGHFPLAALSRYCRRTVRYTSPERDPEAFLSWLRGHLERERYDVAMPVDQYTFYLFSKNRDELATWAKIPVAPFPVFQRAYDKAMTFQAALTAGIPCPKTYFVSTRQEVATLAQHATFPLVIKPRIGSGSRAIAYVHDADELLSQWDRIHREQPCPLIQEYIPPGGEALGVSLLFNQENKPRALFVHKRLREYPLSGGPSTLRESVTRPQVAQLAIRLLRALNWYGLAMVEFKVDPRDGVPKLMEINPKLWGSINLAVASGVDFPTLLYRLATRGDVEPVFDYRVGVRSRFLLGDTLHFLTNPNRFRLQPSFFRFGDSQTYGDIWALDDPSPALGLGLVLLWRSWQLQVLRHVLWRSRPTPGAIRTS
jgi:predicted ATP-grasp superfamily ATP-dependent carboligase